MENEEKNTNSNKENNMPEEEIEKISGGAKMPGKPEPDATYIEPDLTAL